MRAADASIECRVRPGRVEEAAALSELCFHSKQVWGYDDAFMAQVRQALRVKPKEIAAGNVWVAAAADQSIAGVVSLAPGGEPASLDLDKLFIEPGWIGRGFGRLLLTHAVAEARRRGATRLTIMADPNAAAFYERNGARFIRMAPSDAIPGRFVPLYEIVW
ncbi:MAG: GNAT family N-acetyltransferase [Alphaproteobacteria bacterium]|nr:MAG: GNAT family N-acetyltransferase [Alphaproteobacteria bacterium]